MLDYGKSCDSSFPFAELLPSLFFAAVLHIPPNDSARLSIGRLTCLVRKGLSRILDVPRVGLQTQRSSSSTSAGGLVVGRVVTRGRIRGEWTISCYQLGASRLLRADKLLHPHQRTILVPNHADLSYSGSTGLLVSLPCVVSLTVLAARAKIKGIMLNNGISSFKN